jgi:hypothetical protein
MNWTELAVNNYSDDADRLFGSVITRNLLSPNKCQLRGKNSD